MNVQYSINSNIINKGHPSAGGWRNIESDVSQLFEAITKKGYAFSPGILKSDSLNKKPSVADIAGAVLLAVDIDNDIKEKDKHSRKFLERTKTLAEGYYSYEDAVSDPYLMKHALFIYTTPSHTVTHNRFRIVFLLPMLITDSAAYSNLAAAFIKKFGGDAACKNIDRLFYGNTNALGVLFGNVLSDSDLVGMQKCLTIEPREVKKFDSNGYKENITVEMAEELLAAIPGDALTYDEWFRIVSAVGNYFSENEALALIDNWSPDKNQGTLYKIKHRGTSISIGTLIYFAKENGFNVRKLNIKHGLSVGENGQINHEPSRKPDELLKYAERVGPLGQMNAWIRVNYDIRYNIVKSKYEIRTKGEDADFRLLQDEDINDMWFALKEFQFKNASISGIRSLVESSSTPRFNPFVSYFNNLPEWDGHNHILDYINLITVIDEQKHLWPKFFLKWFVAMIACALRDDIANHQCIVLVGEQGVGKTTIIKKLVPEELQDYYAPVQIDPRDKDSKIMTSEYLIINLDELESSTYQEIGHLKSLLTTTSVSARRAYGRYTLNYVRRASFIGSVNKANFLTDITGSRRFLVADVSKIDLDTQPDLTQMYAQGLAILNDGYRYWFTGDEIDEIEANNEKYAIVSQEKDAIMEYFEPYDITGLTDDELRSKAVNDVISIMTSTEIFVYLRNKMSLALNQYKLSLNLQKMGFMQKIIRYNGSSRRRYFLKNLGDRDVI